MLRGDSLQEEAGELMNYIPITFCVNHTETSASRTTRAENAAPFLIRVDATFD